MNIHILTLYPEVFPGTLDFGVIGRALRNGLWNIHVHNIRKYSIDKHKTVDDKPFGGGPGMILRSDVIGNALDNIMISMKSPTLVYTSPAGDKFCQKMSQEFSECSDLIILCGRFEGIDQRILNFYPFREVSLGDFVLSGGEVFAMAMIECIIRLLPNVMMNEKSREEESFKSQFLLEYPQYTRPAEWKDLKVPEVLISGDHGKIKLWREEQSKLVTKKKRADLWSQYQKRNAKVGKIL